MWFKGNGHKRGSAHCPRGSQRPLGILLGQPRRWFRVWHFFLSGVPAPSTIRMALGPKQRPFCAQGRLREAQSRKGAVQGPHLGPLGGSMAGLVGDGTLFGPPFGDMRPSIYVLHVVVTGANAAGRGGGGGGGGTTLVYSPSAMGTMLPTRAGGPPATTPLATTPPVLLVSMNAASGGKTASPLAAT